MNLLNKQMLARAFNLSSAIFQVSPRSRHTRFAAIRLDNSLSIHSIGYLDQKITFTRQEIESLCSQIYIYIAW